MIDSSQTTLQGDFQNKGRPCLLPQDLYSPEFQAHSRLEGFLQAEHPISQQAEGSLRRAHAPDAQSTAMLPCLADELLL